MMVQYKSDRNKHIIIGLIVLGILHYINNIYHWIEVPADTKSLMILLGIGIIYSMMPDCDIPGSTISKYTTIGLVALIIYSFYNPAYQKYGVLSTLIIGVLRIVGHRNFVHSIMGGLIISIPLLYLGTIYFIVGFIAFISHIVLDGELSFAFERDWW